MERAAEESSFVPRRGHWLPAGEVSHGLWAWTKGGEGQREAVPGHAGEDLLHAGFRGRWDQWSADAWSGRWSLDTL